MKYLLDVNVLLAAIWANHSRHAETFAWLDGKSIVLCPLCELGFLRISTHKKAINAPMDKARELLQKFATERQAERISDDLPPLDSRSATSEQVTDHYLADLAVKHGLKLATLDENVEHAAVVPVAKPKPESVPDETSGE
jgi:toxin-antitoxin system PIN domain toxin